MRTAQIPHRNPPEVSSPLPGFQFIGGDSAKLVYELRVVIPRDDVRVTAVEALLARLDRLSRGEFEDMEATSPLVQPTLPGRPARERWGFCTLPDRSRRIPFRKFSELATRMGLNKVALSHRYQQLCKEQNYDPDNNPGFTFYYKNHFIEMAPTAQQFPA